MDKNGKIIGYYVTGTKLFAEDFEDGEDIDIVPKNFILIYKNSDDKYYLCIKRWAYRNWDYTLREWEFKEKYIHKLNKHNANQITRTVIKVIRVNLLKVSENKCPPINTIGIIAKGSNALI